MKNTVQVLGYHENTLVLRKTLEGLWKLMRPSQWIKNLFVLVGIFFSNKWNNPVMLIRAVEAVLAFCLVSSSVYIMNDLFDIESDRFHPTKCHRPLAAGLVSPSVAKLLFVVCFSAGLVLGSTVSLITIGLLVIYFIQNMIYSKFLKHVVIIDVFSIALGFMLRIFTGTWGLGIEPSYWLLLSGLMITLLLGFGKRFAESNELSEQSVDHRPVLEDYNTALLNRFIDITAGGVIVSYSVYTLDPGTVAIHQTTALIFTVPFVIYGIFRYLFLIYSSKTGGDPSSLIVKDLHIVGTVFLWALSVFWILNKL